MTEAVETVQVPKRSRRRRWLIVAAIALGVFAVWVAANILLDRPEFRVRSGYADPTFVGPNVRELAVQSRNEETVIVRNVTVNDRDACVVLPPQWPVTMALGDVVKVFLTCSPVKVVVSTDQGNVTYWMEQNR